MRAVDVGSPFEVDLGAGPATGYAWEVESLPEGVELLGSDFLEAPGAAIGDAGTQVFRLRAIAAGRYELVFVLKRRWEQEGIQEHRVEVDAS